MTEGPFVDHINQDQIAQNMLSGLTSTLSLMEIFVPQNIFEVATFRFYICLEDFIFAKPVFDEQDIVATMILWCMCVRFFLHLSEFVLSTTRTLSIDFKIIWHNYSP